MALEAVDKLAFDRGSVRWVSDDGHLHVGISNISKATVNPYWGKEIPNSEQLGLDPNRKYMLLRHPDELAASAKTFNNLPILAEHVPVSAAKHRPDLVIGSTGTDAKYTHPYLQNSLVFWTGDAIKAIDSNKQRELSCAYHYDPDMTPGMYEGRKFDGIMRNIRGNHVALVKDGRAGADVVVGDSAFIERRPTMPRLSPAAMVARGALFTYLTPRLASDHDVDFSRLVNGITSRNYYARRSDIANRIQRAVDGRLAQDASVADVSHLLEALSPEVQAADQQFGAMPQTAPNAGVPRGTVDQIGNLGPHAIQPENDQLPSLGPLAGGMGGTPTGPGTIDQGGDPVDMMCQMIKQYLEQQGVSPEIINNLDALCQQAKGGGPPGQAGAPGEGDEWPDDDDEGSMDQEGNYIPPGIEDPQGTSIDPTPIGEGTLPESQSEADDPNFGGGDAMPGSYVTRRAMDQAIRLAQDRAIKNQRAIRDAERYVRPWVGDMAMDAASPADVFRAALRALGVKGADRMHPDALQPVLDAQPRAISRARMASEGRSQPNLRLASDSSGAAGGSFADRFPDAAKITLQ